jgi:transposase-like protein
MNHQIRQLMTSERTEKLEGVIEADETYVGGKRHGKRGRGAGGKIIIAGLIERGGKVDATIVPDCTAKTLVSNIRRKVLLGSQIYTDEFWSYGKLRAYGFKHETVNHGTREYARGDVHTNSVESFWAQFKRSVHGTFHHVSPKHCQKYLNEFCYRNNHRRNSEPMFSQLASISGEQRDSIT